MSAKATQAEIERNEIDQGTREKIETRLDNYRHVKTVQFDCHIVKIGVESECTFYDSDAIIGMLVRKFDLDYTGEHHGYLHFGNWKPARGD